MWWLYLILVNSAIRQEYVPLYRSGSTGPRSDDFVKGHPVCGISHSGSAWGCSVIQLVWPFQLPLRKQSWCCPQYHAGKSRLSGVRSFLNADVASWCPSPDRSPCLLTARSGPFHHHPGLCPRLHTRNRTGTEWDSTWPLQSVEGHSWQQQRACDNRPVNRASRHWPGGRWPRVEGLTDVRLFPKAHWRTSCLYSQHRPECPVSLRFITQALLSLCLPVGILVPVLSFIRGAFPRHAPQPAFLEHLLFRKLLSASVFFAFKLDTWFPSFLLPFHLSCFHLSPNSYSSLEVVSSGSLPGCTKLR